MADTTLDAWDRGRMTGLPACDTEVRFYPKRLTPQMRTKVEQMIRTRYLHGGYSSQAKRIAKALISEFEVPHHRDIAKSSSSYQPQGKIRVHIWRHVPPEGLAELRDIVTTAHVAYVLSDEVVGRPHLIVRASQANDELLKRIELQNLGTLHLSDWDLPLHRTGLHKRVFALFEKWNAADPNPEVPHSIQRAVEFLHSNDSIVVHQFST